MFFMITFLYYTVYLHVNQSGQRRNTTQQQHGNIVKPPLKRSATKTKSFKETQRSIHTLQRKIRSQQKCIKNSKKISTNIIKLRKLYKQLDKEQTDSAYLELIETYRRECKFCS